MSEAPRKRLRLDFGNLPLIESAVRTTFGSAVPLTFEAINCVHEKLRPDFPQIAEPGQIELPPGVKEGMIAFGPGQIPGVVFTGNAKGLVVSLQAQVVVVRWAKQFAEESPPYPRYPALRDTLWRTVKEFAGATKLTTIPVVVVNMSYVNFIRAADASAILKTYFSSSAQVEATSDAEQIHKVEASWQTKEQVDLRYSIEQVSVSMGGETADGFRLTTAAGLRLSQSDEAHVALDSIHDRLQHFFKSLISEKAAQEWQLTENVDG